MPLTVITIVPYAFLPAKVGGQKHSALFNKYFARNVRLICVTVRKSDPSQAQGYEVKNILSDSPARYANIFYFFTLRRIIRQTNASLLLLSHPYYGWLGCMLKWFTGVRLGVLSHNIESTRFKSLGKWWWKMLWYYERFTHRQSNYNFFIQDNDREYAISKFGLRPADCTTVTYGTELDKPPTEEEKAAATAKIRQAHQINSNEAIILFNGSFNYKPNLDALQRIIDVINPQLQQQPGLQYKIIVCGRDVPASLLQQNYPGLIILGYVEDIGLYFKGANVFINPVLGGGGIKTKLVEALAYDANAVSTSDGAVGIDPALCNGKLLVCENGDWAGFTASIIKAAGIGAHMPAAYYQQFYWGHAVEKAVELIKKTKS